MRRQWIAVVASVFGAIVGACFTEEPGFSCAPGEGGCECNQGVCLAGLECTMGYCTRVGCEPATEFCVCDDGACAGDLECFEGIVCRPRRGKGDPTGADGTDDGTSSTSTSTSTSTLTTTQGTETSDTVGACNPACAECMTCGPSGECVPDPGVPCSGEPLQCSNYVYGNEQGTCWALASATVEPVCGGQGQCVAALPQDCPARRGDAIVQCDDECAVAPSLCAPFASADAVAAGGYCAADGPSPGCANACSNESGSHLRIRECVGGLCTDLQNIQCNEYSCDVPTLMCNTACVDQLDCAMSYACDLPTNVCYLP